MVRDFYSQAKKIILEIYHAFADEEEQKKIEGELNEGDGTSKEKDKTKARKGKRKKRAVVKKAIKVRQMRISQRNANRIISNWNVP